MLFVYHTVLSLWNLFQLLFRSIISGFSFLLYRPEIIAKYFDIDDDIRMNVKIDFGPGTCMAYLTLTARCIVMRGLEFTA